MIQNSARNGSQEVSGVNVVVGVIDGVKEGARVGDNTVLVGTIVGVTTAVGVSVTRAFTQDMRLNSKRTANICFIR